MVTPSPEEELNGVVGAVVSGVGCRASDGRPSGAIIGAAISHASEIARYPAPPYTLIKSSRFYGRQLQGVPWESKGNGGDSRLPIQRGMDELQSTHVKLRFHTLSIAQSNKPRLFPFLSQFFIESTPRRQIRCK